MKKLLGFLFASIILVAGLGVVNSLYVINEGRQVIITQFGKPIGGPVTDAGLHFKIPFIQKVNYFEKRVLEWDGYPNQIPTKDKKYIFVDTTARWRIVDPLKFFQSVYNEMSAHSRLDDIIDAAVRDAITSYNLLEIVRTSNRSIEAMELGQVEDEFVDESAMERVKVGREKIRKEIVEKAKKYTPSYGIELLDVRIKRINYIKEVQEKVYNRMTAERKRAAERYRSEGRGKSAEIKGQTQKELAQIESEAYRKSQEIKGKADAEATKIYADAYNQDPEFFAFLKTMQNYESTVDQNTTVILTTDSDYYQYLKDLFGNQE